jgi:hypothetical protein
VEYKAGTSSLNFCIAEERSPNEKTASRDQTEKHFGDDLKKIIIKKRVIILLEFLRT